ncbi:MAG: ribonuclease H [Desulfobacterales bacterium]
MEKSTAPERVSAWGSTWVRMRRGNRKVWAEAHPDGRILSRNGRVRIRYRLEDPRDYRTRTEALQPLEGGAGPAAAAERGEGRDDPQAIYIYTDGACSGNPGPAGIGVVLVCGGRRREIAESIGEATNNIAELTAIHRALTAVRDRKRPVVLHTDSHYAFGVLTLGWKATKNRELIAAIRREMAAFPRLRIVRVPGHRGVEENERADRLAVEAIRRG